MQSKRFVVQSLASCRPSWKQLATRANGATLYHDERWLRLLEEVYGFKITVAGVYEGSSLEAACLLARTRNPFKPRFLALPFSDTCPPLAADPALMPLLGNALTMHPMPRAGCEIRGVALPEPWRVVDCFGEWTVDLTRPLAELSRRTASHFRRQVRRGIESGLSVRCGSSIDDLYGFYQLMAETRHRKGLPVQSLRFFKRAHELFSPIGDSEIWSVIEKGSVIAAGLMLRSFDCLHYKWSARRTDCPAGAAQLLIWSAIERHAGITSSLNLGRTDARNAGLVRFKKEAGAKPAPLPYSFYPKAPAQVSAEVLSGPMLLLSRAWRRLPKTATRTLGSALYRYMA
ncbi:MAG TPA: GNAT family N-acetyltransferase [Candidatus Binataceae bacterium]|nr:GNAT family N-acetyltransferase [Candidatus Binataceae bacterium]